MPDEHTLLVVVQLVPPAPAQPPQFVSSFCGSLHALLHRLSPFAQQ